MNSNIKRVLNYIKKYIPIVILSMLMAVVIVCSTLYMPILIGRSVDCLLTENGVDMPAIIVLIKRGLIVVALGAMAQWLMNVFNNKITYGVVRDIRADLFTHIERLPIKYLDAHPTGDIVSRCIADVDQFSDGLLVGFSQFLTGVLTIFGTLAFMFRLNVWCTLVVILLTPISFLVARFIATRTASLFLAQSQKRGEQTALIDETLANARLIKAFSREADIMEKFDTQNEELREVSLKATFYSSLVNPSTRFVNSLVYAFVAVAGAFLAIKGKISVGALTSFLAYATQYTKPFNEISGVVTELQNSLTCAGRVFDMLSEKVRPESEDPVAVDIKGNVDLSHVDFSYDPQRELIKDLNLSVTQGQRIAIVGPTGCGKTTLINLLMRFYDVDAGSIMVEDCDIRNMDRHHLRASYGMVLQDTWLRHDTIMENIRMGREEISDEAVIEAAKAAHAHSFIMRLPKGYDTVVSDTGTLLSAGQKQLLCISRIMADIPPMLILDEATSSIDTRTEQKIQSDFERLMKGRTSFVVAHRLSTIRTADVILVMKDGNIIEQGRHEELLAAGGFYHKLYYSQYDLGD